MTGPYAREEVDGERHECRAHLDWVKTCECAVLTCRVTACDPHHLTCVQGKSMSQTAGDQWAIPVCRRHHNQLHAFGDEARFWRIQLVDPIALARRLWAATIAAGRFKLEMATTGEWEK